jgi:hypothetical protein
MQLAEAAASAGANDQAAAAAPQLICLSLDSAARISAMTAMDVIDALSAALTPVTAIIAMWVAVRQYKLQRTQTRLQLYERRLSLLRAYQQLLHCIASNTGVTHEQLGEYSAGLAEAPFLLDSKDAKVVSDLRTKVAELMAIRSLLTELSSGRELRSNRTREEAIRDQDAMRSWAWGQYEASNKLFEPYLTTNR